MRPSPAKGDRIRRIARVALRSTTGAWKDFGPLLFLATLASCVLIVIGSISSIWVAFAGIAVFIVPILITFEVERRKNFAARRSVLRPVRLATAGNDVNVSGSLLDGVPSESTFFPREEHRFLDKYFADSKHTILILEGGPLVGKTRLAKEWAASLEPRWVVGWLRQGKGKEAVDVISACGEDALIILDGDSPDLTEVIDRLMERDRSHQPRIRLLLVTRGAAALRRSLSGSVSAFIDRAPTVHLGPLGETVDHRRWFDELVRYYARQLRVVVPPSDYRHIPRLQAMPIGVLHLAALSALLRNHNSALAGGSPSSSGHNDLGLEDLLEILWGRESEILGEQHLNAEWGVADISSYHLGVATVALTLLGARDAASCLDILRCIPELNTVSTAKQRNIVVYLHRNYPPSNQLNSPYVSVTPEILACGALVPFVADGLLGSAFFKQVDSGMVDDLIVKIVRWAAFLPKMMVVLTEAIGDDEVRLATAVKAAVLENNRSSDLDGVLAEIVTSCHASPASVKAIRSLIPVTTMPRTEIALCNLQLAALGPDAPTGQSDAAFAALLSEKARLLLHRGDAIVEALRVSTEAVEVLTRLKMEDQHSLTALRGQIYVTHSLCLRSSLQLPEAVQVITQAVEDFRSLTNLDSVENVVALGDALMILSTCLSASGSTQDAYEAVSEAVDTFRTLSGERSGHLGSALIGQATYLQEMPNCIEDARKTIAEAEALFRLLCTEDPADNEASLAGALLTQAQILRRFQGCGHKALGAVDEAVGIYERLVLEDRSRHEPQLGGALLQQAAIIASGGANRSRALASSKRAVEIYERLARVGPSHEGVLADALLNYSGALRDAGKDSKKVLEPLSQALDIYRRLSGAVGGRYVRRYVAALANKATTLAFLATDAEEALVTIDEALRIYQLHAASDGSDLQRQFPLADLLSHKSSILMLLGDHEKAIALARRALNVYESLADKDAETYSAQVNRQRLIVRHLLEESGQSSSSLTEGLTP